MAVQNLEQAAMEAGKALSDPMASTATKVIAVTGSGAAGIGSAVIGGYTAQEWLIIAGFFPIILGVLFGLMQIIAISPKTWASLKWWFGSDRRKPEFLTDDLSSPQRRAGDQ